MKVFWNVQGQLGAYKRSGVPLVSETHLLLPAEGISFFILFID